LITISPHSFLSAASTFAVMFAAFVAWFSELLNIASAGVVHFGSVFSWFKGNQVFHQYLIGGVAIFIGGALIFKGFKRIFNFIVDQTCWYLTYLPVIGSWFWRESWVEDEYHYLTVPLFGQFNPEIKQIKIKINQQYLLTHGDLESASAGGDHIEVFGETQRQGVDANGQVITITGGPGQNFKLTKKFVKGPPPSWPDLAFTEIDRIR
jgi:hypothetical protein